MAVALVQAIDHGDGTEVARLVATEPGLVDSPVDDRGGRPLHHAVAADSPDAARALIAAGALIDQRNDEGRTPLHDALEAGRSTLVQILLAAGATVDVCAAAMLGDIDRLTEIFEEEPDAGSDMTTGLSVLGWASYGGRAHVVPFLVDQGVKLDAEDGLGGAALCDHHEFVAAVLEHGVDPNDRFGSDGRTALHAAASLTHAIGAGATVQVLLDGGADPDRTDHRGRTALDLARAGAADPERSGRRWDELIKVLEPVTHSG